MKTYELEDDEVALILVQLYPIYNDLVIKANKATNRLLVASLQFEIKKLKRIIEKFEEDN